ncbi:hypothetical protein N8371_00835 [Vicingaceae bacterium]|nr:hypothetical protein [Vicingaceae bacterium]
MRALFLFLLTLSCYAAFGQGGSNWREQVRVIERDTIVLDTLSVIPNSELLKQSDGSYLSSTQYKILYAEAKLIVDESIVGKEVTIGYRVFPYYFEKKYAHKTLDQIEQSDPGQYNYFTIKENPNQRDMFSVSGLNKNGSISRGVNFGNNQDLSVNSNLDLQLSGKITEDISIQAAISDNTLPIQAEGNTQQLQEFDRVFIRVYDEKSSLIAGDFRISRPNSYFMNFNKKVQGLGFSTELIAKKELMESENGIFKTSVNAAISRGKFSRNVIEGEEGNQGPYKLQGSENERFIIVLSGTERVYVNGRLMTRGQDRDYVIDYNTAELTFTPNQIINKDLRIVVEFQYSDQNYSRSVVFFENQFKKEKLTIDFNIYSEQDNKNQPLQQDLTDDQKRVLLNAGDDINAAIATGIDSAGYDDTQVRYKIVDSLGQQILVYSKNIDSAIYAARFRFVGTGNGDYVQITSDANGRVYEFVALNTEGVRQGDHDPSVQLVTPKQRQMVTIGGSYAFSKNTQLAIEGAFTNNDLNTFSTRDSADDRSYAFSLDFRHRQKINKKDSVRATFWNSEVFVEQRDRNFQFVERYRDVEFDRDWNVQTLLLTGNESLVRAKTGIQRGRNFLNYELGSFLKGDNYDGIKNGYSANYQKKGFRLQSNGSLLSTKARDNSSFTRHYITAIQKVGKISVGGYFEQEQLEFYQGESDTLQAASLDRRIWRAFAIIGDSSAGKTAKISYGETYDLLPDVNQLKRAQKSENFEFDFALTENLKSQLSGRVTYRKFLIENDELSNRQKENTLLGRLQYDLKALRGFINSTTFYQIGSGLEFKREFSFLQVSDGQGTHLWNDYNGNGVKEFNEFEVAGLNNQFESNYIRVFTPSNERVAIYSNQFNQVLFLKPNAILDGSKGWRKIVGKFSNKAAYRAERKTGTQEAVYNPFGIDTEDSNLVSVNSSFANTFYFNRINPKFGAELFYLNNRNKSLLTNGFQSHSLFENELRLRYNVNSSYSLELKLTESKRLNRAENFANRNYNINTRQAEPKLIFQPTVKFRISVSGIYAEKKNDFETELNAGNLEESVNSSFSTELQFNQAGKGTYSVSASYINIKFNAAENNSLAFEMLDGLTKGNNVTWDVRWQRNLANNLQLNLNYGGRKSGELNIIHTGGMTVRAFF